MIDTINPMNFDLTKNLHGHVRVELRDRWTGRVVDSQEKDNLVTNAVQELVAAQAWGTGGGSITNSMFSNVLPLYSKALGGLFLFNGTLTESASNTKFPSSVKLVGYAGQTSSSDTSLQGSYNAQESVYTSNGFTTTWDFLTSQANGIIASLARTSYNFVNSWNASVNTSFTLGSDSSLTPVSNVVYLGYDKTNGYLYLGLTGDTTVGGVTYSASNIYRVKADFDNVTLLQSYLLPASKWTLVKTLSASDGSASSTSFIYDQYENNFVYADGTTLHIVAIDGTHTTKTLTGTSGDLCVTENYYWRASGTNLYCIEKANVANVQTLDNSGGGTRVMPCGNDIVGTMGYNAYNQAPFMYKYPDGTSLQLYNGTAYSGIAREVGNYRTDASTLAWPSNYLGTIANLDSPVTKTASQTMKITYTLTEA